MMMDSKHPELAQFSKHTPRLLRQQLLNELVHQYLAEKDQQQQPPVEQEEHHVEEQTACRPSLQRFHGALLFVDISGFTPLAQKLDIESLKNKINAYFTMILEIVDKWGGDVIKFAGDALYVVWPTDIHSIPTANDRRDANGAKSIRSVAVGTSLAGNSKFAAAARQALEKAVACGLEISVVCGKYEVRLDEALGGGDSTPNGGVLGRFLPNWTLSSFLSPPKISPSAGHDETVVYLDVHAGVSIGLMAGIDIGHRDRWEYFLIGEPVSRVAEAEGQAEKGDVVICKKAHQLLHNRSTEIMSNRNKKGDDDEHMTIQSRRYAPSDQSSPQKNNEKHPTHGQSKLSCGCFVTKDGLFCVSKLDVQVPMGAKGKLKRSRSKSKLEGDLILGELNAQNNKLLDEIVADVDSLFNKTQSLFKTQFNSVADGPAKSEETSPVKSSSVPPLVEASLPEDITKMARDKKDVQFIQFYRKQLKFHFTNWVKNNLSDDLIRHVHEAARDDYIFGDTNRLGVYQDLIKTNLNNSHSVVPNLASIEEGGMPNNIVMEDPRCFPIQLGGGSRGSSTNELDVTLEMRFKPKPAEGMVRNNSAPRGKVVRNIAQEAVISAELRTVTVMFIKIEAFDLKLLVDSFRSKSKNAAATSSFCYDSFFFLDRTETEINADQEILNRLQECMEVLCDAFAENEGQLRQFIVDDKGTVCIGTFGLRGAVSNDNAASSLVTAKKILHGLQALNLTASIGITSGKAYCGLVGSTYRHEYAVMGPSTNLSARLMCKAPPHGVICDTETKNRDRTHIFEQLNEVTAKGYTQPVMTYRPLYDELSPRGGSKLVAFNSGSGRHVRNTSEKDAKGAKPSTSSSTRSGRIANNTTTSKEKLMKLMETEFYVVNQNMNNRQSSSTSNDMFMKLFGRQTEIAQVFNSLFPIEEHSNLDVFSFKQPAKMVAVCGSAGVGKTALITSVARKVHNASKQDTSFNVIILQNRQSSLHSNIPLNTWKPLLLELLKQVHNTIGGKGGGDNSGKPQKNAKSSRISIKLEYVSGLDIVLAHMAPEFKNMRALLLTALGLAVDHDKETANLLTNREKLKKCVEFIVNMVNVCSTLLRKLILLIIEEIQSLDPWSLIVLHQLWLKSKGISFFVSYSTAHADSDLKSWSTDIYDYAPPMKKTNHVYYEFFKRYDELERFRVIDLHPLGRSSIIVLAKDFFGITIENENDLEKIYSASGGHPLYAVELMKSLITDDGSGGPSTPNDGGGNATSSTLHHRIEEIICFRLDKLDFSFQIVLKAAAVAVSQGKKFTLDLISFILIDNDLFAGTPPPLSPTATSFRLGENDDDLRSVDETPHISISDVLVDLLKRGEFIQIHDFQGVKKEINTDLVRRAPMEFHIPLEQATIYSLLVDDQKHYFHERLALYLHRTNQRKEQSERTVTDVMDEGFHWEKAFLWSRAIRCYMQCSSMEKARGNESAYTEYLKLSYRMYKCMEQETMQLYPFEDWNNNTIDFILKTFFGAADPVKLVQSQQEHQVFLSLKDDFMSVFDVFEADLDIIPVVAILHVRLADFYIQQNEDMDLILFVLGVAFKLYLSAIIGKQRIMDECSTTKQNPSKHLILEMEFKDYVIDKMALTTKDRLHLLATFSVTYHFSSSISVDFQDLITKIAEKCLAQTSYFGGKEYYIHGLSLMILNQINLGEWPQALQSCDMISKVYQPELHSKSLMEVCGLDVVLYAFGMVGQRKLLRGRWSECKVHYDKIFELIKAYGTKYHPSTVMFALVPIIPTLIAMQQPQMALSFLSSIGVVDGNISRVDPILRPVLNALDPWVRIEAGEMKAFDYDKFFKDVSKSGGLNAITSPSSSMKFSPPPMLSAISNVFSNPLIVTDDVSAQLSKLMIFGGCALNAVNAQVACSQLLQIKDDNNQHAQHTFVVSWNEVIKFALEDSPGNSSLVSALNVANVIFALEHMLQRKPDIQWKQVLERMTECFVDDVLVLMKYWLENELYFAGVVTAHFAITRLQLSDDSITQKYKEWYQQNKASISPKETEIWSIFNQTLLLPQ